MPTAQEEEREGENGEKEREGETKEARSDKHPTPRQGVGLCVPARFAKKESNVSFQTAEVEHY